MRAEQCIEPLIDNLSPLATPRGHEMNPPTDKRVYFANVTIKETYIWYRSRYRDNHRVEL